MKAARGTGPPEYRGECGPSRPPCAAPIAFLVLAVSMSSCGGSAMSPSAVTAPGTPVPSEGWAHVPEGTPVAYRNNPPASGPHYPPWLRYQEYSSPVPRPYWVHNLEHGAIVVLYRPDAPPDVVRALTEAFRSIPVDPACGHSRALLMPDTLLPRLTAAVAADFVLLGDSVDARAIRDFALARRNRGPEDICAHGTRP